MKATQEKQQRANLTGTQNQGAEWIDEKQVTKIFGLTHTPLFNLRKAGKIRSISTATDGAKYGKRLYSVESIRAFFASQEQREGGATAQ